MWGDSGWDRDPANLTAMETLFSPYTDSPGTRFLVTRASSFPRQMKTPREGEQKRGEDWAPSPKIHHIIWVGSRAPSLTFMPMRLHYHILARLASSASASPSASAPAPRLEPTIAATPACKGERP